MFKYLKEHFRKIKSDEVLQRLNENITAIQTIDKLVHYDRRIFLYRNHEYWALSVELPEKILPRTDIIVFNLVKGKIIVRIYYDILDIPIITTWDNEYKLFGWASNFSMKENKRYDKYVQIKLNKLSDVDLVMQLFEQYTRKEVEINAS